MLFRSVSQSRYIGFVPVLHGDFYVREDVASRIWIVSGDALVRELAVRLGASRAVFVSDVEGVLRRPPGVGLREVLPEFRIPRSFTSSSASGEPSFESILSATDVTGGIVAKVRAAVDVARQGIDAWIVGLQGDPDSLVLLPPQQPPCGTHFVCVPLLS